MTPEEKKWVKDMKRVASFPGEKSMSDAILLHSISIIEKQERIIEEVKWRLDNESEESGICENILNDIRRMER